MILCFVLAIAIIKVHGQTDTLICDYADRDTIEFEHLPWFGNNAYLDGFLDSIGYGANRIVGPNQVRFHVPVKFWVYRNNAGIGGPDVRDLRNYIDNLNRFYNIDNNTLIGFYMKCEIGFIDDDTHLDVGDVEGWGLIINNKEAGCINIHITNTLTSTALGVSYRARFFGVDGIFLDRRTYTTPAFASTIAHEVGHYFELYHTHQYFDKGKCRKEAIDRNRTWPSIMVCPLNGGGPSSQIMCEATGDGLSDTPADPELNSNNSCVFGLTGTDHWGDHYETPPTGSLVPDTRNIMSYNGDRACRVVFSRRQIGVLLWSIYNGKSKSNRAAWQDAKGEYDEYEMDNFSDVARPIALGVIQERNFNQQYNGGGSWGQCDVDWVTFTPACSGTLNVTTSAIAGRTNANTRLTLFNNALTQLAQNDNISGTNLFSTISWPFTAGQNYFIRVENMSVNTTGYYTLQVGNPFINTLSISGNDNLCPSGSYSVTGLPTGATVSWSASPSNIVSFSCTNCLQPTISRVANGTVTITATASVTVCGTVFTRQVSKPVNVGGYNSSDYPVSGPSSACSNAEVYFNTNTLPGATDYAWFWPNDWSYVSGNHTPNLTLRTGVYNGLVGVRVANACDAGGSPGVIWVVVNECGGGWGFMVSPNPGKGKVNITTVKKENQSVQEFSQTKIYNVKVYDQSGTIRKQYNYSGGITSTSINLSDLVAGIYLVQAFNGISWVSQQVIKQ